MIKILCVGKIKEKYIKEGIADYQKRIGRFAKFEIKEIAESPCDSDPQKALECEAEKILGQISSTEYVIGLDPKGKQYQSEEFAKKLETLFVRGNSDITFLIGSSFGYAESVKDRCDELISFSKMTFPHQLFRLILCEQIYRAFKINRNETYHK